VGATDSYEDVSTIAVTLDPAAITDTVLLVSWVQDDFEELVGEDKTWWF